MTVKKQNMDQVGEVTTPPTWTPTSRDPDTGELKKPEEVSDTPSQPNKEE
jgi:hypothetical protein